MERLCSGLADGLGIIKTSSDVESLAASVENNGGVYFVPAFTGLGAPYWSQSSRGTMVGLTRGTTNAHIARAAIESIAFQTMDVLRAMNADASLPIHELRVDGGATANNMLMQYQSDILNCKVIRPKITETTALGAAYLAGLAIGFWNDINEIENYWTAERTFEPVMNDDLRTKETKNWAKAVKAALAWAEE